MIYQTVFILEPVFMGYVKQRSRLIAVVDTLGLSTAFLTLSIADLKWPELAHVLNVKDLALPSIEQGLKIFV